MRSVRLTIAAALVLVPLVAVSAPAAATTPDHTVTLTTANSPQTWDGTDAVVGTNQSYNTGTGEPCPDEPSAPDGSDFCDVALVHVDIDPAHWTTNPGGVVIRIGDFDVPESDFDLFVYESDAAGARGTLVGSGTNGLGVDESVPIPNASGYYLVHVVYWAVVSSGYTGTAETFAAGEGPLPETRFYFHDDGDADPVNGSFDTTAPTGTTAAIAPGTPLDGPDWHGNVPAGQITTLEVEFWQTCSCQALEEVHYDVSLFVGSQRYDFRFEEAAPGPTEPVRIRHFFSADDPGSPLPITFPGGEVSIEIEGVFLVNEAAYEIHHDAVDFPSNFAVNVSGPKRAAFPPDVDEPPGLQEVLASDAEAGWTSRSEPHIAQNPLDPEMLIAGSKFYNKDPDAIPEYEFKIGTYVSFDGGRSWTDLGQLATCPLSEAPPETWPDQNTCYPEEDPNAEGPEEGGPDIAEEYITSDIWVHFDDEGNAYAMVLDAPPFASEVGWGMTLHRWESVSPEDLQTGQMWSDRIPINLYDEPITRDVLGLLDDKNTFAVNNAGPDGDGQTGILVACWGQNVSTAIKQQIVCERSTDGGASWPGTPIPISGVHQLVIGVHVVADPNDPNTFYATWLQYLTGLAAGAPATLEFNVTHDGGLTWLPQSVPIATVNDIPRQFPNQDFRNLSLPIMAAGPDGELYITYAEYLPAPDPANDEDGLQADIRVLKSTDGGLTWDGPANITADTGPGTNPNADQFQPYVAVTESGQVNVIFFDRRHDLRTEDHDGNYFTDVFLARSNDGGQTWADVRLTHDATDPEFNAPVSGSGLFFGDYQGLVVDDCNAIPFVNDTHLANDQFLDPGPVRDPDFDDGLPSSPYQQAVNWRVPNTTEFGGTREAPCGADLVVSDVSATSNKGVRQGEKVTITGTIANQGGADAGASTTEFLLDGTEVLGLVDTPAIPAGASADVSITWDTRGVKGEHEIRATADRQNAVAESDEGNNTGVLTLTVQGNKVKNASFEQGNPDGSGPAHWEGQDAAAGRTEWSDGGSEGEKSASLVGNGESALLGTPRWMSAPIAVEPGETLTLVAKVRSVEASSPASAGLVFLGAAGEVLDTVELLTAPLQTQGFVTLEDATTVPLGVAEVRVVLAGFAPTDLATAGTVTFDEIGLFGG